MKQAITFAGEQEEKADEEWPWVDSTVIGLKVFEDEQERVARQHLSGLSNFCGEADNWHKTDSRENG